MTTVHGWQSEQNRTDTSSDNHGTVQLVIIITCSMTSRLGYQDRCITVILFLVLTRETCEEEVGGGGKAEDWYM